MVVCHICNKEFNSTNPKQIVCSKECRLKQKRDYAKNRYIQKRAKGNFVKINNEWWYDRGISKTRATEVICEQCGKKYYITNTRLQNRIWKHHLCSAKCRGEFYKEIYSQNRFGKDNPNWKGGYIKDGYKIISNNLEHRIVIEKHLRRKLKSNEIVHHKDLNRLNNNINNLKLFQNHTDHIKFHNLLLKQCLDYIKRKNKKDYNNIINGTMPKYN